MLLDTQHVDPPSQSRSVPAPKPEGSRHRDLREDEFWRHIPGYAQVSAEQFRSHLFQQKHTVSNVRQLHETLGTLVPESFYQDLTAGLGHAPMALRISPYLLALVDWSEPVNDPIRTQFLPLRSQQVADHPMVRLDSLAEQADSPVRGLTHRYPDKALFLPQDSCPVYCRFCTRSYAVGQDTAMLEKVKLVANLARWEETFAYIAAHPELEDIVISGGDSYNLSAGNLELIGRRLLAVPHIRRLRYATKGLCVLPQKILTDEPWLDALTAVAGLARQLHKDVAVHTHFNHPAEITGLTRAAMGRLTERGILVRCQTVLQRTVNDSAPVMQLLVRRLGHLNIHPYYVFTHDMVPGVEDLRTSLASALELEKQVRGITAGFNTPAFVVDTMGGGGKRGVHSFEHYDPATGIAVFTSPSVKPGRQFLYFDPLSALAEAQQWRWSQPLERQAMMEEALAAARH